MSAYALQFFPQVPSFKSKNGSDFSGKESKSAKENGIKYQPYKIPSRGQGNGNSDRWCNPNDVLISIISASIDPIRLIQAFANPAKAVTNVRQKIVSMSSSFTGMNLTTPDSDEQWGEYCDNDGSDTECSTFDSSDRDNSSSSASTPQSSPTRAQQELDRSKSTTTTSSAAASSHDDAIQFELCISFNGRKYNATRHLPSFIKLRNDLMTELSNIKASRERRNKRQNYDTYSLNKEYTFSEEDVVIPELPIGSGKKSGPMGELEAMVGMVGSGFRGLQATVGSYKPQMESWIQSVAALVPSSPTLANFLWEPLGNGKKSCEESIRKKPSHSSLQMSKSRSTSKFSRGSLTNLDSILEASDNEESEISDNVCYDSNGFGKFR
mmetsp:Transcript_25855/g.39641  ORF Transcript_25855/g.39641 Transcript_25855/m.39641 type:complete len:381 (-) Transcript_25855:1479-2621(-)|eukprot:CAMPEP_0194117492 /NCGR_PEP_ID=MMETSP0150-20130528/31455_1 /TAXON_ID=122233 /ORGANISM="Chaetoceros debilis, Strain MM31A-1" /LENGTH=380 /DNA_ID=CAMNT_0038808507 /DNA_START=173 /DNA_END=1315 /DNA_ORIENTATION=+